MSHLKALHRCASILTALGALVALLILEAPPALAQDEYVLDPAPAVGTAGDEAVDPREAALDALEQVQFALSAAATSGDGVSAAETVQAALNLLEGSEGPHFIPVAGAEGELPGAIGYLESLAGIAAEELAEVDLEALIEEGVELPEVLALAHLLLARDALVEGGAGPDALEAAAAHVAQAVALLGGDSAWTD